MEKEMTMWIGRLLIYLAGIGAGGLALAGYADFDTATWMLDIHPFKYLAFAPYRPLPGLIRFEGFAPLTK